MRRAGLVVALGLPAVLAGCRWIVGSCPERGDSPELAGSYVARGPGDPETSLTVDDDSLVVEYASPDGHRYRARYAILAVNTDPPGDASAGERCHLESGVFGEYGATRIPLDVFVQNGFAATIESTSNALVCGTEPVAGVASCDQVADVARIEGCGRIAFVTAAPGWPRDRVFDATSGALIGAGRLDDVGTELEGTSCVDAAYVAGEYPLHECADAVVRCCDRP